MLNKDFAFGEKTLRLTAYAENVIRVRISDKFEPTLFERYGIMCRGGIHCAPLMHKRLGTLKSGAVRFSVEASNTEREAEYVVRSVRELIKEGF